MPGGISRSVKHQALILVQQGEKPSDIARDLSISERSIRRAQHKLRIYGDIEGGQQKVGRKSKISIHMEEVIAYFILLANSIQLLLEMVYREPSAYLSEYVKEFNTRYPGVDLRIQHLSKIFKARGINRKKVLFHKLMLICSLQ